jgi:8-oxo-dGTP pyrophosphatase MutT (NUDIX family)
LRPRAAAALILIDRAADPPRVLMGRRNPKLAFMGDRFVFPGGRVDPSDRRMQALGALPQATAEGLASRRRGGANAACALALAAIRETYEETGYLVGGRVEIARAAPAGAWSRFAACGVLPRLDGVRLIARAITPPGRVRRFDTAFLCVEAHSVATREPRAFGLDDELVEIAWIALDEIEKFPLPVITRVIFSELAARLDRGLDRDDPVPFYRQIRGRWRRETL